jgi:hypothetical protein
LDPGPDPKAFLQVPQQLSVPLRDTVGCITPRIVLVRNSAGLLHRPASCTSLTTKVFKVSGFQSKLMILSVTVSGGQQLIVLQTPAWCWLTGEIISSIVMGALFFKAGVFLLALYQLKTKLNGLQQYTCEFHFSPKCNKAIQSRRDDCCNARWILQRAYLLTILD